MKYTFYTADVFTDQIFGGNQLAVFPNSQGLTTKQMQKIAAEFKFSETVFVFPPQTTQGTRNLRIFTPVTELHFAGHPTIGAAYILSLIGDISIFEEKQTIFFEETIGLVPVSITIEKGKPVYVELKAIQSPVFNNNSPSALELASILGLKITDFRSDKFFVQGVSCGVPFLFVPLHNREALGNIQFNHECWKHILANHWAPSIYVFCFEPEREESDLRARMFAPSMGILEDPATGSAAIALGNYLTIQEEISDATFNWTVEQGFEMGRPSILKIIAKKKRGKVREIWVGGSSVLVSEGSMEIPEL
ncbi:PhzF family phenazine biosynthesis protein [Cyanobacterium sp. uoEpiScrs1]|uniref:PhzF family phenazine biosynthesis protein n=1 Tax=Cyanobacterium sp. uoEpiScrs1 TaxID=2976343 RepID=UPI0022698F40|nr:PhzF family phenazine biosynthesis protein [Cyanobacterium sp. uoEpiScrs1]